MQTITTIGLDIAKSVFQVHGVDAGGQAVVRRQLKRRYVLAFFQKLSPCLVGKSAIKEMADISSAIPTARLLEKCGRRRRKRPQPKFSLPLIWIHGQPASGIVLDFGLILLAARAGGAVA